jgi:hypothetical protein
MSLFANQIFIGWSLLASGIVFILSFVFLALMFATRASPWGPLNDVTYVLALILILPFLFSYFSDLSRGQPIFALIALLLGAAGISLITYTQLGLVLGKVEFSLNLRQGAFGAGLLGLAFIINHLAGSGILPYGLNGLGLAAGILMVMGIPTGLFYGKEELAMTTGQLDWKAANRLAISSVFATFLGQILLIIFVIVLGFHFL